MNVSKRSLLMALTIALALMLSVAVITTLAGGTMTTEQLQNGGFEKGFSAVDGCGMVGSGWGCFTTGGRGGYGFYDEGWAPVVAAGSHAQLIEINTKKDFGDQNRTAGIYQKIAVVPGQTYELNFKALIRANDLDSGGDPWRYVMMVGFTHDGSTNWANATVQEVNVGPIQDRVNPSGYYPVSVKVKAQGHYLTIFIAGRMKWGDWNREVDFDVDGVSLVGPAPAAKPEPKPEWKPEPKPEAKPKPKPPVTTVTKLVCDGPNLLQNSGFEKGFDADGTGRYWAPFKNDGRAAYGYYDDTWGPVVAEGKHAQLLEINTHGQATTDPNRMIGVYQGVWHLKKGATYQLSLQAMIREAVDHSDEDANRYEVYWGYQAGNWPISDVSQLDGWFGVPVSGISLRTSPGAYSSYSTTFVAPSKDLLIYLVGLKKWATLEREVDFDLDNVQLRQCHTVTVVDMKGDGGKAWPEGRGDMPDGQPGHDYCTYAVMRGDTLSAIAKMYHTSTAYLADINGIANPSLIYPMQSLLVPCKGDGPPAAYHPHDKDTGGIAYHADPPSQASTARVHVVKRGEYLGQIAARYGTTVKALTSYNHIKNASLIRPGQKILIPA